MRRIALFVFVIGSSLAPFVAAPAQAQAPTTATRTWVSGVGDDMATCSRTAPCKTFAGAHTKTSAGGEINCLDSGGFGEVTITKSITISCVGVTGGILSTNAGGSIRINTASSDFVVLKGLDIDGGGSATAPSLIGIWVINGGLLHIEDCIIRNYKSGASGNGIGIRIEPTGSFHFVIARTTVFNNGTGSNGGGVVVVPNGGYTTGVFDKVIIDRNVNGIVVDGFAGTGGINIAVRDSTLSGNTGVAAVVTSGVSASLIVKSSTIVANVFGLVAANAGASVRVSGSTIAGNGTAIGGPVLSLGNNEIMNNAGGEAIGPIALK